ncbi:MAG: DUF4292 domain-containing protein [Schleiferiaceae bacterium]|jgi:hypothetical protein|nr:DUF4292 domain-containing protein [Schleiferiaceae bacterium]
MNKLFTYIAASLFLVACKTTKFTPGVPSLKNPKQVVAKIYESTGDDQMIWIKASGKYEMDGDKQGFKADIRIIRDSLIWIELSDPIVGIKAGRGLILKDSVAFINRIENNYMAGSMEYFSKKLETHLEFDLIQNLLLGEPIREIDVTEKMQLELLEQAYALYYFPKNDELFKFTQPNYYFEIEPTNFKLTKQEAVDGGHKISANYANYKEVNNSFYPGELSATLAFENIIKLELQYSSVKNVDELRVPFKISSKYKRIE